MEKNYEQNSLVPFHFVKYVGFVLPLVTWSKYPALTAIVLQLAAVHKTKVWTDLVSLQMMSKAGFEILRIFAFSFDKL